MLKQINANGEIFSSKTFKEVDEKLKNLGYTKLQGKERFAGIKRGYEKDGRYYALFSQDKLNFSLQQFN